MKLTIAGVDVSRFGSIQTLRPGDEDLAQPIVIVQTVLRDRSDGRIPKVPDYGLEALLYDDDGVTLRAGGYISRSDPMPLAAGKRAWSVEIQSWAVRLFETSTGSLNKAGITDSDRNFFIAIVRDALKNQSFGVATGIDDAIITANEPDWPLVRATAFLTGSDWSYARGADAIGSLLRLVPGVFWRARPDKLVQYGRSTTLAPYVLTDRSSQVDGVSLVAYGGYGESEIVSGHVNKIRRGGTGAAEETATDEVSHVRFRRIIESPYKNDEAVPAADLRRRTYAELRAARVRRVAKAATWAVRPEPGQLVDVVNTALGNLGADRAPFLDVLSPIFARSATGRLATGYRGRMVVQRVSHVPKGNRHHEYALQLGDPVRDFATALAVKVA